MIRLCTLVLAVLLLTPGGAFADPVLVEPVVSCNVLTDGADDVSLEVASRSKNVDDQHLDLRFVDVAAGPDGFSVMVNVADLDVNRRGTWMLTFVAKSVTGTTTYGARASLGAWSEPPARPTFTAGVVGRMVRVRGEVEIAANTVVIEVPYRVLGKAGQQGTRLSGFTVAAEESVVSLPAAPAHETPVRLRDTGASKDSWRVGHSCGTAQTPPVGAPPPPGRPARMPG